MRRPVTLTDILEGHAVLDIDCLDRIYLNGYVPALQSSGQLVGFLNNRGYPIPSPAALGRNREAFIRAVDSYAEANGIEVIRFGKGERKLDRVRRLLEAAEAEGVSKVVAIGKAQEEQWVYGCTEKEAPNGIPWSDYYRTVRRVGVVYYYIWDERVGPAFIKVCSHAPYPVKVWANGHEIVKRSAARSGLQVSALTNGFASCDDPAALQDLADQVQPGTLQVLFERWMSRLPLPLSADDRAKNYWWQLSMRQIEYSRTIVFDDPRRVRAFFELLLADNLHLGRPEHIEVIFNRKVTAKTPGNFGVRLLNRGDQVTMNLPFKHSRIKIYLKQDRALRVETVVNDPGDLGCLRGIAHLEELSAKARDRNARLMDAVRVGQGSGCLASPVFARIAQPTRTADGRRAPAMRFGDPRVQALAGSLTMLIFTIVGITNASLRAAMSALLGVPYSMNQAGYDLARLRVNGLIKRVEHTNTYTLTPDGQRFALFYSKLHDQVLFPLIAADQPLAAPPELKRALGVIDRHITSLAAATHLGRAA